MAENNLVYELGGKIYINLTNRCTNACVFCIRNEKADVMGKNLFLTDENFTAKEVIEQLSGLYSGEPEVVFCGYGEPTLKLEILKEVAKFIKKAYPRVKTRLNTNGSANKVCGRDVTRELVGLLDTISVSLNAENSDLYNEISCPSIGGFEEVKEFIRCSVSSEIATVATVVIGFRDYKIDVESCREIAESLGATLRVREWLPNGY